MVGHIWMCMYVKVGGDHSQSIYHNRRLLKTQCLFLQLVVLHVYGNQPKLFWVRMLWILSALLVPAAKVWEGCAYCCDHGYIAMSLTLALALITVRAGHACPLEWNEFRCVYITLWVLDRAVWLPAAILQWILSAVAHCASTGYKMGGTRKESSVNVMLAPAYVIYPHHVASIQVLFALAIIHRSRSSVKIFNVKAYKYSWEWSWVDVGSVGSNQITY